MKDVINRLLNSEESVICKNDELFNILERESK